MNTGGTRRALLNAGSALVLLAAAGCVAKSTGPASPPGGGPPPQAPAHGARDKHTYVYYPDACVYYDAGRNVYFFMEGSAWKMVATLPAGITLSTGSAVTLEMEADVPYVEFEAHRRKYPPGQAKKDGVPPGQARKDDDPGRGPKKKDK
jgi:hypothetical protein